MRNLTEQQIIQYIATHNDELWEAAGFPLETKLSEFMRIPQIWCSWCGIDHKHVEDFDPGEIDRPPLERICKKGQHEREQLIRLEQKTCHEFTHKPKKKVRHPDTKAMAWCTGCKKYLLHKHFFPRTTPTVKRAYVKRCKYHFLKKIFAKNDTPSWWCQQCHQVLSIVRFPIIASTERTFSLSFLCDLCDPSGYKKFMEILSKKQSLDSYTIAINTVLLDGYQFYCHACQQYHSSQYFDYTVDHDLKITPSCRKSFLLTD